VIRYERQISGRESPLVWDCNPEAPAVKAWASGSQLAKERASGLSKGMDPLFLKLERFG
jgi:hypothetical protein